MLEVYFKLISIKKDNEKVKYPYALQENYTFTKNQIEVFYVDKSVIKKKK